MDQKIGSIERLETPSSSSNARRITKLIFLFADFLHDLCQTLCLPFKETFRGSYKDLKAFLFRLKVETRRYARLGILRFLCTFQSARVKLDRTSVMT